MGLFDICESQLLCSTTGTRTTLVFSRATRTQNSSSEIVLSFASNLSLTLDLQPEGGTFPRYLAGTLRVVNYTAIYLGNPDVIEGDRVTVCSAQLEVVNVLRLGTEYAELALAYVR